MKTYKERTANINVKIMPFKDCQGRDFVHHKICKNSKNSLKFYYGQTLCKK